MSNKFYVKRKTERILGVIALVVLIAIAISGRTRHVNGLEPKLTQLIRSDQYFEQTSTSTYKVFSKDNGQSAGYIAFGEADGYGGPLKVAALFDTSLMVQKVAVIDHKETPSYVEKVYDKSFERQLTSKGYKDAFELKEDIDAISGATYTSEAIAVATRLASYSIAHEQKGIPLPEALNPSIEFGAPEIILILLFAISLWATFGLKKWKKQVRWGTMVTGMLSLGFWLSVPLSLQKINTFLLAYWPQWQTNIYWYLLMAFVFIPLIFRNKRTYCNWMCPLGATQECLGLIGGSRISINGKAKTITTWIQRGLAFFAIAAALYFQNPGKINYEIFGTFFNFIGTSLLFLICGLYILASMFIKRPYCNTLCPITPFGDYILMMKKWLMPEKHFNPIKHTQS